MTRQDHDYHRDAGRANGKPSPNPHRLYRSNNRILGGVCDGIAAYFGWRTWIVRSVAIFGLLVFTPTAILTYLAAWWFFPLRPETRIYKTAEEERFWRNVSTRPRITLSELRHRFRGLEGRIADMEHVVTSEDYQLRGQFRDLEG